MYCLKIWESKLLQSRAVDGMPAEGQQTTRQQYVYPHGPPNPVMTARAMAALPSGQLKQGWFFEGWPVSYPFKSQ